jgi:hypothetical protein
MELRKPLKNNGAGGENPRTMTVRDKLPLTPDLSGHRIFSDESESAGAGSPNKCIWKNASRKTGSVTNDL